MIGVNPGQNMKPASQPEKKDKRLLAYVVLGLFSLALMFEAVYFSLPYLSLGLQNWPAYINLNWAHREELIAVFIYFFLVIWLSVSALFFGGWLLRRSIRKFKGKGWAVESRNGKKKFFPPILLFLKLSCVYLICIFLFVISQYPLQFIIYAN